MSANAPGTDRTASSSSSKSKSKKKLLSPSTSWTHVNPSPVPEMSATGAGAGVGPAAPAANGERQRGPVEEVIAKRMRQLGKKLQRYRTYVAQPIESLNADQKAALVSLPSLEGAYKELEDLIRDKGPVDEQELIQAAKMREASEAAERTVEATAAGRVEAFQDALVHPLSRFMRLHALLHPAKSSDHTNLTFERLDLPSNLRDEVQATDLLRVGRMYEDLLAGGDGAKSVIQGLAKGTTGDDEEDHVHHLMQLLDQPDAGVEPDADQQLEVEGQLEESEVPQAVEADIDPPAGELVQENIPPVSRRQSDLDLPNGHSEEKEKPATGGMLNFLQDDELAEPGIEDSYEVEPMLEPHQTSGLQPPVEDDQSAPVDTPDTSAPPTQSQTPAAFSAPTSQRNWAEIDDDEDDEPVFTTAPTTAAPQAAKVEEEIVAADNGESAVPVAVENELADETPILDPIVEVPTTVDSSEPPSQTPVPIAPTPVPASLSPSAVASIPSRPRATSGRPQQPRPKEPATVVDEDGFEMKVRRAPQQATRGRGGREGGSGERGRGGPGRGRGGRGGGGGGGPQQSQGPRRPKPDGPASQAPAQQSQSAQQARPKSIFKDAQSNGPKSTPVN